MTCWKDTLIEWLRARDIEPVERAGIARYDALLKNDVRMTIDKDMYDADGHIRIWVWIGAFPFATREKERFAKQMLNINHTLLREKSAALRLAGDENAIVMEVLDGAMEKSHARSNMAAFLSHLGKTAEHVQRLLRETKVKSTRAQEDARWMKPL
ncbi:MAG: hypothetical protein OXF05_01250 [Hyphomicrobiales bacterium]|nr:hypothetical protein [Hyphomicrobiales bacterium]